jgi:hypothetical protein
VRVDEAGRDDAARGVDLAGPAPVADLADRDDAVAGDADVGPAPGRAGAVDQEAVADDELDVRHGSHGQCDGPRYLTIRTLQPASWLTFLETLPKRTASSSPTPREPTTTRSIWLSFA